MNLMGDTNLNWLNPIYLEYWEIGVRDCGETEEMQEVA